MLLRIKILFIRLIVVHFIKIKIMAKYALISMMGNVGGILLNSQGSGYYTIVKTMIKHYFYEDIIHYNPDPSTWNNYDALFVCEGVNFIEGSFNIPGGIQPLHLEKMRAIANYKGPVKFINKQFDFQGFNKRTKLENTEFPMGNLVDLFTNFCKKDKKCVIGDSHALSVWKPGYSLDFTPGRTLHGFLKRNTPELINEKYNLVTLYFGCIDIRFHLMRQENPKQATLDLFTRYVEFAKQLKDCTLATIIPVEHPSRKIPGTGLYKKKPFFGTRAERQELVELANEIIKNSGLKYIAWPDEWNDETGEKMLNVLESRQSVHLKPKNWKYINEMLNN